MEKKKILIIGGTGYIGSELTLPLAERGYSVSVFTRTIPTERHNIDYVSGDVLLPDSLNSAIKGVDTVLYLAAVIRTTNKKLYKENTIGLTNTISAMKEVGVGRIMYFSTINAIIQKTGPYGNSKKESEKIVRNSQLDYTIIRPNFVYGVDIDNDLFRLAKIIKNLHLCPIIGSGKNIFEPINKKDIPTLVCEALIGWRSGRVVHLSGKERVSLNQVADRLTRLLRAKAIKLHIPINILNIFKLLIPFDIQGYDKDRVADGDVLYGCSDLEHDLEMIVKLVKK